MCDWESVKLLENRGDVVDRMCPGDHLSCSILNKLKFMEGLEGETREKGVAVIQAGGDQRVDQDGGAVGGEGGMETVDVTTL